jgi:gluconolactonase
VGALTTNLAFGGAGMKKLFIVESATASILVADAPHPGLRLPQKAP